MKMRIFLSCYVEKYISICFSAYLTVPFNSISFMLLLPTRSNTDNVLTSSLYFTSSRHSIYFSRLSIYFKETIQGFRFSRRSELGPKIWPTNITIRLLRSNFGKMTNIERPGRGGGWDCCCCCGCCCVVISRE